jgi:hypothetical protein
MIVVRVRTKSSFPKVRAKAKQGNINSLGHAGAAIRLAARRSIRKSNSASTEGQPPNTRRGQLRRSIMYAVDKGAGLVIIGPQYAIVGRSARAHEFGGRFRRERYPKRPFMGPALEKLKPRLPRMWAGSVST